jgi:hypothetical protein
MCDVLPPPGVNPTAVKYIISYPIIYVIFFFVVVTGSVTFVLLPREGKVHNSFDLPVNFTVLSCKYEALYCVVIHSGGLSGRFLL